MPICNDCSLEFYLLKEGRSCNMCILLAGKKPTEKLAIKEQGQCKVCSLVYSNLDDPMCRPCCVKFSSEEDTPEAILKVPGALKQMRSYEAQKLASEIITDGAVHQSKASEHRLHKKSSTGSSDPKKIPTRFGKNLTPAQLNAQSIIDEMKLVKDNASKIHIAAALWLTKTNKSGNSSMVKDPKVQFSVSVSEDDSVYDAIGKVIEDAQEFHKKSYPIAHKLTRQNLSIFAHQSPQKAFRLPERLLAKGTARTLLDEFRDNNWISRTTWENREMEVRLVVDSETLFPTVIEQPELSQPPPSSKASGRRQSTPASSKQSASTKRKLSAASTADNDSSITKKHFRQSGWNNRSRYTRDVSVVSCQFIRTSAELADNSPNVLFKESDEAETIEIAQDWEDGWRACLVSKNYGHSGFIGMGSSKNVIYARFNGNEYALGQLKEGNTPEENYRVLRGELENLVQGEAFRASFEELAGQKQVELPAFVFNLEGAIFGRFQGAEPPCGLPYFHFIATRLLPCSSIDKQIEKFTGHADCGAPPARNDAVTMAMHAFTHYMIVYSLKQLVLCDLQGMYNRQSILCLIDPQAHSATGSTFERLYWDEGPQAIARILEQHMEYCHENVICSALELRTIEVELGDSESESGDSGGGLSSPFRPRQMTTRTSKTALKAKVKVEPDDSESNVLLQPTATSSKLRDKGGPSSAIVIDSDSDDALSTKKKKKKGRTSDAGHPRARPLRIGFPNGN